MKKLKNINIKYFQTHEDTTLEFSDGITVLVGKTDSGKTAIIRSIKLITKNKPRGNGFISAFAPKDKKNKPTTKITLTLEDDTQIIRTKSENKNEYIIKTSEKEEAYNNFGVNIPPEIEEVIGPMSVKIDQETSLDVNMAEQLSQPFLLFESPAIKTKLIDKIARIDVLNKAIKNTKTQEAEIKSRQKVIAENLETQKTNLSLYDSLEAEKKNLEKVKDLYSKLQLKQDKLNNLQSLLNKLSEIETAIQKGTEIKKSLVSFLNFSVEKLNTLKEKQKRIQKLSELMVNYQVCSLEIDKMNNILFQKEQVFNTYNKILDIKEKISKQIRLSNSAITLHNLNVNIAQEQKSIQAYRNILKTEQNVLRAKNNIINYIKLNELNNSLNTLNQSIFTANQFIPEQKNKVQIAINELNQLYQTIKVCPVCKKPFDINHN